MIDPNELNLQNVQSYEDLRANGFLARKDCRHWPFSIPVEWDANPFGDKNWVFMLQSWAPIAPMLQKHVETADPRYLIESIDLVLDWWEAAQSGAFLYRWNDMATGIRAMRLAYIFERAENLEMSAERRNALDLLVDRHARKLMRDGFISLTNHGIFQAFGLNLLSKAAAGRRSVRGGEKRAAQALRDIVANQFTAEGVHAEHSPSYHKFALRRMQAMGIERHFKVPAVLETAKDVQPWLTFPDGRIAGVGDSAGVDRPYAGTETVGDFTASGYAIARGGDWMLFVSGMCRSISHKHADETGFELFDGGRYIFMDTGRYGYIDNNWRRYARSAAAHNTVSVAGREIARGDVEMVGSCLSGIRQTEGAFVIDGEVNRPGLFRQRRMIEYVPGRSLHIIDDMAGEQDWTYVSSLHLAPDLLPKLTERGFEVDLGDGRTMRAETDAERVTMARGETDPIRG